jgi:hypothetical protein
MHVKIYQAGKYKECHEQEKDIIQSNVKAAGLKLKDA